MPRTLRHLLLPVALCTVAVAALSGCTPTPSPTTSPSTSASASAAPKPTSSAIPSPTASATPVTVGCNTVVTPDDMYTFNPNYGLLTKWTPAANSAAATALSESGIACRWMNQTSGDDIDISVAHLDAASIENLKNEAVSRGTLVPTYGDEAYFGRSGNVGTAVVFQGDYWLVATSTAFFEPGDPADLIDAALSALK